MNYLHPSDEKPVPSPRRLPRGAPVAVAQLHLRGSENFCRVTNFTSTVQIVYMSALSVTRACGVR